MMIDFVVARNGSVVMGYNCKGWFIKNEKAHEGCGYWRKGQEKYIRKVWKEKYKNQKNV